MLKQRCIKCGQEWWDCHVCPTQSIPKPNSQDITKTVSSLENTTSNLERKLEDSSKDSNDVKNTRILFLIEEAINNYSYLQAIYEEKFKLSKTHELSYNPSTLMEILVTAIGEIMSGKTE